MPRTFTVVDEPNLILPEDSIHRAKLLDIKEKAIEWNDARTGEHKSRDLLEWWWEITVPGNGLGPEFKFRKVKGSTDAKLTNHSGNKFREWAEALLTKPIDIGTVIDVDDLIGLEAEIVIAHRPNKKDPSRPWEEVSEVISLGAEAYENAAPF